MINIALSADELIVVAAVIAAELEVEEAMPSWEGIDDPKEIADCYRSMPRIVGIYLSVGNSSWLQLIAAGLDGGDLEQYLIDYAPENPSLHDEDYDNLLKVGEALAARIRSEV